MDDDSGHSRNESEEQFIDRRNLSPAKIGGAQSYHQYESGKDNADCADQSTQAPAQFVADISDNIYRHRSRKYGGKRNSIEHLVMCQEFLALDYFGLHHRNKSHKSAERGAANPKKSQKQNP